MYQRRVLHKLMLLAFAAQPWLSDAGPLSAQDAGWRMVTSGKLEKTAQGNAYALRGDNGEVSYRIASAQGLDLNSFVGRRVQVVGKLNNVSSAGVQSIQAEKLVLADQSDTTRVADTQPAAGSDDGSVLERVRIQPQGNTGEPPARDDPPELVLDDSAVFLNQPLNAPLVDDSAQPLTNSFDSSFYEPQTPYTPEAAGTGGPTDRIWFEFDGLAWWSRRFELPSLLTTSPVGTPQEDAGVLGKPTTTVLVGQEHQLTDIRPGARFQIGGWLGPRRLLGLELDYAGLEDQSWSYAAASNGSAILARPFFNVDPVLGLNQGQDAALVSYPNLIAGNVTVNASSKFRDLGVLMRTPLLNHQGTCFDPCNAAASYVPGYRIDLVGGYRYYRLDESLTIDELLTFSVAPQAGQTVRDEFLTDNTFHGGELGLYGEYYRGRWSLDGVIRLALGNTTQEVEINGMTETSTVGIVTPFTGGLLAQTTNIGSYKRNKPDLIPEFGINVGYMLTGRLQMVAGYTIIYWPHTVRPGNQIDLVVNGSYIPDPSRTPAGAPAPRFELYDTGYWVQGFNLGLDYRW